MVVCVIISPLEKNTRLLEHKAFAITLLVIVGIPAINSGVILECFIESYATIRNDMSTFLAFFFVIGAIIAPTLFLSAHPAAYTIPIQIFFSVILTAVSTWLGIAFNMKRAKKDATAKWLPAAEAACKTLLTLSSTVEATRLSQSKACKSIEPMVPEEIPNAKAIKTIVEMQCTQNASTLRTLQNHIENAISHWQVFISANCEGNECALIEQRLNKCRAEVFSDHKEDVACSTESNAPVRFGSGMI